MQADLKVCWAQMSEGLFSEVVAHIMFTLNMGYNIGLDKGGYLVNIFLISPRKHMLWVLIRSASARHF